MHLPNNIDPFVINALRGMVQEIEHHLANPDTLTPGEFQQLVSDFDKLAQANPEAYAKINDELKHPFYGKGEQLATEAVNFAFPLKMLEERPEGGRAYTPPLGLPVWLVYENGVLGNIYLGASNSPLFENITDRLLQLVPGIPTYLNAWSQVESKVVHAVVYIPVSNWEALNEVIPKPTLYPVQLAGMLVRGVVDAFYGRNALRLTPITQTSEEAVTLTELGFDELQQTSGDYESNGELYYIDGELTGLYREPETTRVGTVKKIGFRTTLNGYVYPVLTLDGEVDGISHLVVYDFKKLMMVGLQENNQVTLRAGKHRVPEILKCNEDTRKMFMPGYCPSCGSKLLYEGGDERSLFIRCTQHLSCKAQAGRRFLFATAPEGIFPEYGWMETVTRFNKGELVTLTDLVSPEGTPTERRTVPLVNVLKGLALPGVAGRAAGVLALEISDFPAWLNNKDEQLRTLEYAKLSWSDRFQTVSMIETHLSEFLLLARCIDLDYTPVNPDTQSIAVVGSNMLSRWHLSLLLRDSGLHLSEEISEDTQVVLAGYASSKTLLSRLESRGVVVIDTSAIVNLQPLIEKVKTYAN